MEADMKSIIALLAFTTLLAPSTASFAAASLPAAGSYGFDWLKNPKSAHCEAISKAMIKKFKGCKLTDGSFGGDPAKAYQCKVDSHREYMVYETKAACAKALETESANE